MKKLISAATSLVMAASMASAVVPFATGAAALKTLEIRPFNGASTTVDASAGDVKVPIGIYLKETAPTSDFISAQIKVTSSNGDPKDVEFLAIKPGAAKYFAEETAFTGADGDTYKITQAPGFAGELKHGSSRDLYTGTGQGVYNNDASYALAGADYAFASTAWVAGNDGYKWAGATSDALPVMIVEVTFKQGTKPGDYTIEFCDYKSDSKNPEIKSCMIESDDATGRKMTTDNGYLALGEALTIKVKGDNTTETQPAETTPAVTTAPPQEETKAPTTAAPTEGKTNAPAQSLTQPSPKDQSGAATWEKGAAMDGFVVKSGEWNVEAGKTFVIDVMVESGGIDVAQLVTRLNDRDLPTGFSVVGIVDGISEACGMVPCTPQGEFYYIDNLATDGSAQPIDDSAFVIQYEVKVDDTVPTGSYDFALSRFTVATDSKNAYEAKIIPGKINVTNPNGGASDPGTVTTKPVTTAPETKPDTTTQPVTKDQSGAADWEKGPALDTFIVKSGDWTAKPGQKFIIDVMVDSGDADVAQLVTRLNDRDLPEGFKVVGIVDGISEACGMVPCTPQGEFYYIDNLATDGSAQKIDDSAFVIQYEVEVASTVKAGKYDFALSRFTVAPNSKDTYEAKIIPGTITVDGPTDGPTDPPTDPGQQEDTTNGGASDLTPAYGDVNCDGKVNIADVVILCAWMNDSSAYEMKDQNKLNADCCDEKKGTEINSNDADAILQNIIDLVQLPCKSTDLKSFS